MMRQGVLTLSGDGAIIHSTNIIFKTDEREK